MSFSHKPRYSKTSNGYTQQIGTHRYMMYFDLFFQYILTKQLVATHDLSCQKTNITRSPQDFLTSSENSPKKSKKSFVAPSTITLIVTDFALPNTYLLIVHIAESQVQINAIHPIVAVAAVDCHHLQRCNALLEKGISSSVLLRLANWRCL